MEWNENLKTGITDIDEQHKRLFQIAAKLDDCMSSRMKLNEVLIELQTYIFEHFQTEEEYMKYTQYPLIESHKSCHDKFIEDYKNIIKKLSDSINIMDLAPEIVEFIKDWMENHYTNEDVSLAEHINKSRFKS